MHSNLAGLARMVLPLVALLSACASAPPKPERATTEVIVGRAVDASKLAVFACMTASPTEAWRWTGSTQEVLIHVAADGSVRKAEVDPALIADETYLQCVAAAVSSLRFPASAAPTSFALGFPIGRYEADGRPLPPSTDEVGRAIRSVFPWIRQCPADVSGNLKIHFTFDLDGSIRDHQIASPEFMGSEVAKCVVERLLKLHYRSLEEELPITFPFSIRPPSEADLPSLIREKVSGAATDAP